jgi:hypothetical protein
MRTKASRAVIAVYVLALVLVSTGHAADDPPSGTTASGRAHEFGAAVKRDAKLVAASVKEGAHRVAVAAKAVGHEVSTAAKRGAAETRAAMKGEKGQTTAAKGADPAGSR